MYAKTNATDHEDEDAIRCTAEAECMLLLPFVGFSLRDRHTFQDLCLGSVTADREIANLYHRVSHNNYQHVSQNKAAQQLEILRT